MCNIEFFEPVAPVLKTSLRHRITDMRSHSGARTALADAFPWKEGEDRSRLAGFIAVIEMVSTGVIEVDGLLDESESKHSCVKIVIAPCQSCDGRNVVQ